MWIPRETANTRREECRYYRRLWFFVVGLNFVLLLLFSPLFGGWGWVGEWILYIFSLSLPFSSGEEVVTFGLPKIVSVCRHSEDAGAVCTECEGEVPWHLRLCQDLHDPRNGQQTWPLPDHWCQLHSGHQRLWERMLLSFSSLRCKRECSFSDRNCLVIQLVTSFAIFKAVTDTCGTPAIVKAVRQVTHLR